MPHPLVLALFRDASRAASAARDLRAAGLDRGDLSIVARTHEYEGRLADALEATPGSELEDSPAASRLGELGAHALAAIATVLPGIGGVVSAGPLSAELGEAAGHAAGGIASMLERAGVEEAQAAAWEERVRAGDLLLGAHVRHGGEAGGIRRVCAESGADEVLIGRWQ